MDHPIRHTSLLALCAYTDSMNSLDQDTESLRQFFDNNPKIVVLTGAGISAASGIPTYRDEAGRWLHNEPIQHQEFIDELPRRKRYWARSMRGWPRVRDAAPNTAHHALATLEAAGHVSKVITQNVDRLHQRAGSQQVIDLHGRLDRVECLECGTFECRDRLQRQLEKLNPGNISQMTRAARPDGDADLPEDLVDGVRVPHCADCGGMLMPDVVFYGGTVPRSRVDDCMNAVENADALLTIGSSLQVFSGYRFCRHAAKTGKPIAIINPGVTRADDLSTLKFKTDCVTLLQHLTQTLHPSSGHDSPS